MKRRTLALALALKVALLAGGAMAEDVLGTWRTEATVDGYLEVRISNCGQALCGEIVRARNPQGIEGPFEHIGRQMIWGMSPTSQPNAWDGGQIWDPISDRTFNSRMELTDAGLMVSGCVLGICRSQRWRRVSR